MTKCDVCGKEFRTGQGLGGHMRWVHGIMPDRQHPLLPPRRFITDEDLLKNSTAVQAVLEALVKTVREDRERLVEQVEKPLTNILSAISQRLDKHDEAILATGEVLKKVLSKLLSTS